MLSLRYDVQLYGMLQDFFETNTHLPTQGNERWVDQLPTRFLAEFKNAKPIPWVTTYNGRVAGEVRSAGGQGLTAGNVTFVNVYDAGYASVFDFLSLQLWTDHFFYDSIDIWFRMTNLKLHL